MHVSVMDPPREYSRDGCCAVSSSGWTSRSPDPDFTDISEFGVTLQFRFILYPIARMTSYKLLALM